MYFKFPIKVEGENLHHVIHNINWNAPDLKSATQVNFYVDFVQIFSVACEGDLVKSQPIFCYCNTLQIFRTWICSGKSVVNLPHVNTLVVWNLRCQTVQVYMLMRFKLCICNKYFINTVVLLHQVENAPRLKDVWK